MATIRAGNRGVLLVVDVQVDVMKAAWDAVRVVGRVARVVERARAAGVPVLWIQHEDEELVRGSPGWEFVPALAPAAGELRVAKRHNSAFEETALDAELAALGASHLVVAGAQTQWCIRCTVHAALERGYDLTLVEDAHTTEDMDLGSGRRIAARDVVDALNLAMTWSDYPGRVNAATAAEAVEFGRQAGSGISSGAAGGDA